MRGSILLWHERSSLLGAPIGQEERRRQIDAAHIFIILVSQDLCGSEDCWGDEMLRAIERHERGEARAVPVFLLPSSWTKTRLAVLSGGLPDPKCDRPNSARKHDDDKAFVTVVRGIEQILAEMDGIPAAPPSRRRARFDRALYLQSFLERMRRFVDEQDFGAATYVELEKHVVSPTRNGDGALPKGAKQSAPRVRYTRRRLADLVLDPRAARVTALLGNSGSGKSVALRRLAVDLARRASQSASAPLPVLLSLGTYTAAHHGVRYRFVTSSSRRSRAAPPRVPPRAATGSLDGEG